MRFIRDLLILLLVVILPGVALADGGTTPAPGTDNQASAVIAGADVATAATDVVTIEIANLQFSPAEVTIAPGTTVRWINLDPVEHDVTSGKSINGRASRGLSQTKFPDGIFSSGLFGKQGTFSYTFKAAGEHPYFCSIHPFMTGVVTVK